MPRNRTAESRCWALRVRRPAPAISSRNAGALRRRLVVGVLSCFSLALITRLLPRARGRAAARRQGAVAGGCARRGRRRAGRAAVPRRLGWTTDLFDARSENEELRAENEQLRQQVIQNAVGAAGERRPRAPARVPRLARLPAGLSTASPPSVIARPSSAVRADDRRRRRLGRRHPRRRAGRDRRRARRHR